MQQASTLPIVYVLDPSVAVTGAFVAARNMARALKVHARIVLVLPEQTHITRAECSDFWRVEHIPFTPLRKQADALLAYLPNLMRGSLRLRRLMRGDGSSCLILNDFYLMHGVLLRMFGYRGRNVSFVRCDPARFAGALAPLMLWLERMSGHQHVAVSSYVRSLLRDNEKIPVLYDYFSGATSPLAPSGTPGEKRLVAIGNYIPGKGQDMALEAFVRCAKEDPELTLHFCGGDMGLAKNRDYRQSLIARAEALGLSTRVHFHEFMNDPSPLLSSAFAALNFSQSESFSMTVLEASGYGLPVIATQSGGPQEILVEGETGLLIPVGDVDAASIAIRALASDPTRAHAMGQAGAARVAALFGRDQFAQALRPLLGIS